VPVFREGRIGDDESVGMGYFSPLRNEKTQTLI
jgi:hypothetical protein